MMVTGEERISNVLGYAGNTQVKTAHGLDLPAVSYVCQKMCTFLLGRLQMTEGQFGVYV